MLKVAVLHNKNCVFPDMIVKSFYKAGFNVIFADRTEAYELCENGRTVFIAAADSIGYFSKIRPHIFAAAPGATAPIDADSITCGSAVLCGEDAPELSKHIKSERIVTYGMSAKDTVTISSAVDKITLALQREIITLSDKTVEMQEILIPIKKNADINNVMAVACVQIITGTDFDKFSDII